METMAIAVAVAYLQRSQKEVSKTWSAMLWEMGEKKTLSGLQCSGKLFNMDFIWKFGMS